MLGKRKGIPPRPVKVKEVTATRAIFVAGADELHRIELEFTSSSGERISASLNLTDAARLITQLKASYNAALPKHHSNIH
jgi:hypothetical protein